MTSPVTDRSPHPIIFYPFARRGRPRFGPEFEAMLQWLGMIRIAIAAIAIVLALAGATFSFRAQGASCLTLAQAKIETAQWQAVKVIEPVKVRTVAVEPAARERFDVVFYGGAA